MEDITMQDIVGMLIKEADKYAVESEETIYNSETEEWEKKKCKKINVTIDLIVDFCREKGIPIPKDLKEMFFENDEGV